MKPGSPEWQRVVSASKVPAILALSPWESQREMWYRMRGDLPPVDETRPMRRGHMLENAVLDWFLADHPHLTEKARQTTYRLPDEDWCIATPDMDVVNENGDLELVDAKTGSDDSLYGTPGTDEVPTHYAASSMWQLAMAPAAKRVHLAVLTGRPFDIAYYVIERDDELCGALIDQCRAFHASLSDDDAAPALSDMPTEYDAIRTVHPDIDRDLDAVIPDDLADRYLLDLAHEKRSGASKARLLDVMGNARRAKTESGLIIARRQPKGDAVTLVRVAALPEIGA